MKEILAATINIGPTGGGGFKGIGPLGLEGHTAAYSDVLLNNIISTTLGVMTIVAFIWFIVQLFSGVISIIGSGGDKGKFEQARNKISTSVIGLVVVIAAVFLIDLIGNTILGIDILNGALSISKIVKP